VVRGKTVAQKEHKVRSRYLAYVGGVGIATFYDRAWPGPYLATLLGHHAGLSALDEQRVRVARGDVLSAIVNAAQEFYGRMSGRFRSQLKTYAGGDKISNLGIVAGVSLLSNGFFRIEDLRAPAVSADGLRRCEELVAEMVGTGLLIENNLAEGRVYSFSEDGIAPYLWLLSVEKKLREPKALGSSPVSANFTPHQTGKTELSRPFS
jgi:hypothetical protein